MGKTYINPRLIRIHPHELFIFHFNNDIFGFNKMVVKIVEEPYNYLYLYFINVIQK